MLGVKECVPTLSGIDYFFLVSCFTSKSNFSFFPSIPSLFHCHIWQHHNVSGSWGSNLSLWEQVISIWDGAHTSWSCLPVEDSGWVLSEACCTLTHCSPERRLCGWRMGWYAYSMYIILIICINVRKSSNNEITS